MKFDPEEPRAIAEPNGGVRDVAEVEPGVLNEQAIQAEWVAAVFAGAAEGIVVHDMDGQIVQANSAACRMLGRSRRELVRLRPWEIATDSSRQAMIQVWRGLDQGMQVTGTWTIRRKEGAVSRVRVQLSRFKSSGCDWVVVTCWDPKPRARGEKGAGGRPHITGPKLRNRERTVSAFAGMGNHSMQEMAGFAAENQRIQVPHIRQQSVPLVAQLTELAEHIRQTAVREERNRLARELHDTLAQGFTGIIVQLEAARDALQAATRHDAEAHLRRATQLARRSLGEARRAVQALRPEILRNGSLCAALERMLEEMTTGTSVHAHLTLNGRERSLAAEREENLLRISQEALTNTVRHAHARRFEARLTFAPDEILLDLRDNGRGFDPRCTNGGLGLKGMRERAERIQARLTVWSLAQEGTWIRVALSDASNPADVS